jgi:uncharacterized membrane protein YoaK (UPF0700 family)
MDERHGPLPVLLLVLTGVTGLVDAASYLGLGHAFVANMTGNVVFLGFAAAHAADFSISTSLTSIAAFLAGAFAGGAIGSRTGGHRPRLLAVSLTIQIAFLGTALALAMMGGGQEGGPLHYALIVLLALAMGLQNATARRLGVPDLQTTVLTVTLTGIAADTVAGWNPPRTGRRLLSTAMLCLGAAAGALLFVHAGVAGVLGLALALLVCAGIASLGYWPSTAAWTVGT